RRFVRPLVADFIVRQGARYYAVRLARPRDPLVSGVKLRDEWYPLYVALGVHGILHVDVEEEQVQVVDFEVRQPSYLAWRRMVNRSLWFLGGALAALAWLHSR
ncbi:MAG: hypothetical protein K6T31_09040, partial [Alicyclobacillus sp.]|nr:hypothetical protein [Alicyclobacillus sp.]